MDVVEMSTAQLLAYRKELESDSIEMACGPQPSGDGATDCFEAAHDDLERTIWKVVVPEMNRRGIKDVWQR